MKTSPRPTSPLTPQTLIYCPVDSHANLIPPQAKDLAQKTKDTFGHTCFEPYVKSDQLGLWAKMFAGLLAGTMGWFSMRCTLNWKAKATKSNRLYFQLQASTRRTKENESGLWLTPSTIDIATRSQDSWRKRMDYRKSIGRNGVGPGSLSEQVHLTQDYNNPVGYISNQMLKTPTAADSYTENLSKKEQKFGNSGTLAQEVQSGFIEKRGVMLPTPTAGDGMRGINANTTEFRNGRFVRVSQTTGTEFGASLGQAAATGLLPTPRATEIAEKDSANIKGNKVVRDSGHKFGLNLTSMAKFNLLPTPTVMDSTKNGDMTAPAKMMMGATHRSSGQPIQKTLTDAVQMEYLKTNPELAQELANKPMLKRTQLPPQAEFVEWIRQTSPKQLSEKTKIPLTKVEHWFRKDAKGFSHPSIQDWNIIKQHLQDWQQFDHQMTHQESIEWAGMLPTPSAQEPGWSNRTPLTKDGKTPTHPNQRWYDAQTGRLMQKGLQNLGNLGMLPTPRASEAYKSPTADVKIRNGQYYRVNKKGEEWSVRLIDIAASNLLPTPTASDYNARGDQPNWQGGDLVSTMHKKTKQTGKTSQLNPLFVEEMMGFPKHWTVLPFQSGEKSP